jgi:hypothetical protein
MNLVAQAVPDTLSEKEAFEFLFLTRRLQYLSADYNDDYSAGFIRNKLKDVSSTRKLITSLSVLDKHHRDDPRDY